MAFSIEKIPKTGRLYAARFAGFLYSFPPKGGKPDEKSDFNDGIARSR